MFGQVNNCVNKETLFFSLLLSDFTRERALVSSSSFLLLVSEYEY
jgi:hypothetical protein